MEKHSFLIARRKYRSSASSRAVAPDRSTDVNSTLVPAAGDLPRRNQILGVHVDGDGPS
jgi:hypothetical protein